MANWSELKARSELLVGESFTNDEFFIYANKTLEDVSEVARTEAVQEYNYVYNQTDKVDSDGLPLLAWEFELPTDYFQVIKVEIIQQNKVYTVFPVATNGTEMNTTDYKPNFEVNDKQNVYSLFSNVMTIKSIYFGSNATIKIYYYKYIDSVPYPVPNTFDLTQEPPLPKNFHDIITLGSGVFYYENFEDSEREQVVTNKYLLKKAELEQSTNRRHNQNILSSVQLRQKY